MASKSKIEILAQRIRAVLDEEDVMSLSVLINDDGEVCVQAAGGGFRGRDYLLPLSAILSSGDIGLKLMYDASKSLPTEDVEALLGMFYNILRNRKGVTDESVMKLIQNEEMKIQRTNSGGNDTPLAPCYTCRCFKDKGQHFGTCKYADKDFDGEEYNSRISGNRYGCGHYKFKNSNKN